VAEDADENVLIVESHVNAPGDCPSFFVANSAGDAWGFGTNQGKKL
jgi:hypothetical protein